MVKTSNIFWTDKLFPGWKVFLLAYLKNEKTAWSATELARKFVNEDYQKAYQIATNIANACYVLEKDEQLISVKVNGRLYYGVPSLFQSEENNKRMLEGITLRPRLKAFAVPTSKKTPGSARMQINRVRSAKIEKVLSEAEVSKRDKTIKPLLISRKEHCQQRIDEILLAVVTNFQDKKSIPREWLEEYEDLIIYLNHKHK